MGNGGGQTPWSDITRYAGVVESAGIPPDAKLNKMSLQSAMAEAGSHAAIEVVVLRLNHRCDVEPTMHLHKVEHGWSK